MKISLASCRTLPPFECDDEALIAALEARGCEVKQVPWDDAAHAWERDDLCLLRSTWDYSERYWEFRRWLQEVNERTLLLNPLGLVRWNLDKRYLLEMRAKGVAVAETRLLEPKDRGSCDAAALDAYLEERGWEEAFLKPCVGQTSRETLRFDRSPTGLSRAEEHLRRLLADEAMLLQPWLPSVTTRGEVSLFFFENAYSHAVRKIPRPGDWRTQDDFGAKDEPYAPRRDEMILALDVVTHLPDPLYVRVDLLDDGAGRPLLNEIEAIEPSLFFRHAPQAAERFSEAILARLGRSS